MGNHVSSCILLGKLAGGHQKTIKVILPGGEVRCIGGATSAAELMLDMPGHFLVCSASMKVGRRFSPLVADEDLEIGNVYAMLPMKRMNASVTTEDMAGVLMLTSKEVRRAHGWRSRVLPDSAQYRSEEEKAVGSAVGEKKLKLDEMADDASPAVEAEVQAMKNLMNMSRSRRPRLETIEEEP